MAVDTAEKRKSVSGTSFGYCGLLPGVTPNSGKDQEWRQEAGWSYSGILAEEFLVILGARFIQGDHYLPGFYKGDHYLAGFKEGDDYLAGFQEGEGL